MTPFEVLVSTLLSQSTTAANERRGLDGLLAAFGPLTPFLASAPTGAIARAIWHSGLSAQKAPRSRAAAREVQDRWSGTLEFALQGPTSEARRTLISLPDVGPNTADVVLAMVANHPTFHVDTHIARIAWRWRLVTRGGYETTRAVLEAWTPPARRRSWHLALIAHGRELCKARNPHCEKCPIRRDCDWYRLPRHEGARRAKRVTKD